MSFEVNISRRTYARLAEGARWYAEKSGSDKISLDWYEGFMDAIRSLSIDPDRYPQAHESDDLPFDLREMYYGSGRKKTHRASFRIADNVVRVLTIRHFAERDVTMADLDID